MSLFFDVVDIILVGMDVIVDMKNFGKERKFMLVDGSG